MAIYNIFDGQKNGVHAKVENAQKRILHKESETKVAPDGVLVEEVSFKERFFSSFAARFFFFLLLCADVFWILYAFVSVTILALVHALTFCKSTRCHFKLITAWRSCKRSLVCGVCLFLSLFSPSFGIMIGCTYFMMYDPKGIEEVVPSSLQSQFKEFFT